MKKFFYMLIISVMSVVVFAQNSNEVDSSTFPNVLSLTSITIGDRVYTNNYWGGGVLTNSTNNIILFPLYNYQHATNLASDAYITPKDIYATNIANSLAATNGFIKDTNFIIGIVKDGTVCSVIGHKWEMGCGQVGCLVIHYESIRRCVICGKTQTQKVSDWQ